MSQIPLLLLLLLVLLPLLPALPVLPEPDPVPVQPSQIFPSSSPPVTIPAFPEQSDVEGTCPLNLPDDLFHGISSACSASNHRLSRSRCCPALAAWLYSAYSATALAVRALPAAQPYDLPVLPDDSESCVDGVEKALRARGVPLPRLNDTCDVAYCYCGVRLRRLSCPGAFVVDSEMGRWVAKQDKARIIERECARPGLAGCSRCLKSLFQLKGANASESDRESKLRDRECQLMGVTWLLSKNRTLYMPTATSVLRALTMNPDGVDPTSCSLPVDSMPLAVDSTQIDGPSSSSAVRSSAPFRLLILLILLF